MPDRYLIKNASILNVSEGTYAQQDILICGGIIAEMGDSLSATANTVLDAVGLVITPGWVDSHVHFFRDSERHIGVDPRKNLLPFGVTYAVEPGTSGANDFQQQKQNMGDCPDVDWKAYLNISKIGIPIYGLELTNMDNLNEADCVQMLQTEPYRLIGIKARINRNVCPDPIKVLRMGRKICDRTGLRFCLHATGCDLSTETILSYLGKGDTLTHCYAQTNSGILDERGLILPCVQTARERGVIFDIGHGSSSFSFEVAQRAIRQGFLPDSISSDLHIANTSGPVYDMPTTLNKLLCLGFPVEDVIRMVTATPAEKLGLTDKNLILEPGQRADLTAFRVEEGNYSFTDCCGITLPSSRRIVSAFTCVGNNIYYPHQDRDPNRKIGLAALQELHTSL